MVASICRRSNEKNLRQNTSSDKCEGTSSYRTFDRFGRISSSEAANSMGSGSSDEPSGGGSISGSSRNEGKMKFVMSSSSIDLHRSDSDLQRFEALDFAADTSYFRTRPAGRFKLAHWII